MSVKDQKDYWKSFRVLVGNHAQALFFGMSCLRPATMVTAPLIAMGRLFDLSVDRFDFGCWRKDHLVSSLGRIADQAGVLSYQYRLLADEASKADSSLFLIDDIETHLHSSFGAALAVATSGDNWSQIKAWEIINERLIKFFRSSGKDSKTKKQTRHHNLSTEGDGGRFCTDALFYLKTAPPLSQLWEIREMRLEIG